MGQEDRTEGTGSGGSVVGDTAGERTRRGFVGQEAERQGKRENGAGGGGAHLLSQRSGGRVRQIREFCFVF